MLVHWSSHFSLMIYKSKFQYKKLQIYLQRMSNNESQFLETILDTLLKKNKKPTIEQHEDDIKKMHQTMDVVLSDFDKDIKTCKKYNEAKIHRKYEIAMVELQKRVRYLNEKVKAERDARSPSKKYVDDLLDKLVDFKFKNGELEKQNLNLKSQVQDLVYRLRKYETNVITKKGSKELHKNLPSIHKAEDDQKSDQEVLQEGKLIQDGSFNLKKDIDLYLQTKYQQRKQTKQDKSMFERFLKKHIKELSKSSFRELLHKIDDWSQSNLGAKLIQVDKISSNFSKTFNISGNTITNQSTRQRTTKQTKRINIRNQYGKIRNNMSLRNSKILADGYSTMYPKNSLK